MTYRQALQITILALDKIYDNAGSLRDHTNYQNGGKEAYNNLRGNIGRVVRDLKNHDNSLSGSEAIAPLKGDYSIKVGVDDI